MSQTVHRDSDLVGLVRDYFSKTFTPEVIAEVERDGPPPQLWRSVDELGLPLVGIDEDSGGSGGSLLDLLAVMEGAGRYAVPLPLAETSLAAWLLARAGAEVPAGPLSVVPDPGELTLASGRLTGRAAHVPWVRGAARIVAVLPDESARTQVVVINAEHVEVTAGADLAGMPRDTIRAVDVGVDCYPAEMGVDDVLLRGALLRAAQMAGAITAVFELTKTYVGQRVQFGRPIGTFQAVQAHLVELAQASALSALSVDRAGAAALRGSASFEIVATKSLANRHAGLATRAAHQAHGAIGMTQEYSLQLFSRRLHTWRGDFGDETTLNLRLGATLARTGGLTSAVTSPGSTIGV
ncbi:acyl-CoA dehydrogenase family protein [Mycobacterium sp.]|uniref:acyl-CoA dehydrogenase family protein n=1 Tax=Mycobacterium sp. TaxID=1785 RepID=UPI003C743761